MNTIIVSVSVVLIAVIGTIFFKYQEGRVSNERYICYTEHQNKNGVYISKQKKTIKCQGGRV